MVVSAYHDGPYFAVSNHFIEFQSNFDPVGRILIKHSCFRTDDKIVLSGVANPVVVIPVLRPSIRVDTAHGSTVGLCEVFIFPAETDPPERAIAIIEQLGAGNGLDEIGKDEPVFRISAVSRKLFHACFKHGFHD